MLRSFLLRTIHSYSSVRCNQLHLSSVLYSQSWKTPNQSGSLLQDIDDALNNSQSDATQTFNDSQLKLTEGFRSSQTESSKAFIDNESEETKSFSDNQTDDDSSIDHENTDKFDLDKAETSWKNKQNHTWNLYLHGPQMKKEVHPESTSVLLFPGQGSQFVGMGSKLLQVKGVKRMFEAASEQFNKDILKVCLTGPEERLKQTSIAQVLVYITSLAAVEKLQQDKPEFIQRCVATAGFSVGEIAALVFAGSMTFEEGLHLVRVRASAMQEACNQVHGGMMTVFSNGRNTFLRKALATAREYCASELKIEAPVCTVANYLCTNVVVIAGHQEALDFVANFSNDFKLKKPVPLKVNGAFHTRLMFPARRPFNNAFDKLQPLRQPSIPVLSNYDALPFRTPATVRSKLVSQITCPVKWEQILHNLYQRPSGTPQPHTFEVGPGRQLGYTLKLAHKSAYENYVHIEV